MRKIKIFRWADAKKVEDEVNEFVKDKRVISIQYRTHAVYNRFNASGTPINVVTYDSAMVEYEEPDDTLGYVYADDEKLDFRG